MDLVMLMDTVQTFEDLSENECDYFFRDFFLVVADEIG